MDIERTGDRDRGSRRRAGGRAQQRGSVCDGFLLRVAMLVLFAAAAPIAIGMPQELEFAANHANAAVEIVTDREPVIGEDYPFETIEEPIEPLIVDDIRTAMMFA